MCSSGPGVGVTHDVGSPTIVATDPSGMLAPTAAYAPDGQLWVTWVQNGTGYVLAKLGDSSGAGGQPILLPTPSGYDHALLSSARVDGNLLVLATNWESTSLERLLTRSSVTAEFVTVVFEWTLTAKTSTASWPRSLTASHTSDSRLRIKTSRRLY